MNSIKGLACPAGHTVAVRYIRTAADSCEQLLAVVTENKTTHQFALFVNSAGTFKRIATAKQPDFAKELEEIYAT